MTAYHSRYHILEKFTNDRSVINEISEYTENKFTTALAGKCLDRLPLPDEPYVAVWNEYLSKTKEHGVFNTLKAQIVQFQFPILEYISQQNAYKLATRRGITPREIWADSGLELKDIESLSLRIHHSAAGGIPVLVTANDDDFCTLVQALSYKNEPVIIPKSMGAAMITGLNNWDRIATYKRRWLNTNPLGRWDAEFANNVLPNRSIYQDKLIVLSRKPYSGVLGSDLAIEENQWLAHSLAIRLEHECTHFFTLRYFGHMANNMHDELVADYMGINKVLGKFKAEWFLKFVGLEDYPQYRVGARFENYVDRSRISPKAFQVLATIVFRAAANVEKFDHSLGVPIDPSDRLARLLSLCAVDMLSMSSDEGLERLLANYMLNKKGAPYLSNS